jgi:cobalamin synthase
MVDANNEPETLEEEVDHIVEESRMVLPGIQALFGFQLIAVFNQRFTEVLPPIGCALHLFSLILVAVSIALIMAPAAYHRQAERGSISRYFANYASRLVTIALLPLLLAISLEVSLVAYAIAPVIALSSGIGAALAIFFIWLWFVFPAARARTMRRAHGPPLSPSAPKT